MAASRLLDKQIPSITVVNVGADGGELHGLGQPVDAFACGREFVFAEICPDPTPDDSIEDSAYGYLSIPFAIAGRQKFPVRCTPDTLSSQMTNAFDSAAEHQVGEVLWFGDENWADGSGGDTVNLLYLSSGAVATSGTGGTNVSADIATVLSDAFEAHPDLDPILHLGMQSAMEAGTDRLGALGYPYVVNPAYPIDGVAVTGPIKIYLGTVQDLSHVDWNVNRQYVEGTRLGRIEFDPCLARIGVTGS